LAVAAFLQAPAAHAQGYEIWALDQGTHIVHVYDADLKEVDRIDLGAAGVRVPHMIDFSSDSSHAVIAATSGFTVVIRAEGREIVAQLETGPGSHMASFKPDDSAILVAVIGVGDVQDDGKVVEVTADLANGKFEIGRSLAIAEDPMVQEAADRFGDIGAVCHEYSPDGRFAYVTLGPALDNGGLVVLDTESFQLVKAYPPGELKVNCGTMPTPDGRHMIVNGGSADVGIWYALDMSSHAVVKEGESRGKDAHGVWATPDGREIWMVNRVSSNGIVIDAATLEITGELSEVGKTPDIIAMSPDSQRAFITTRGPNPVTAPHVAKGETPGFAVVSIPDRKLIQIVQPAEGNEQSDFHGIGVRIMP
jgi:DNA-binding beta-propeller fold protein YncE